ncbi:hypothetical protein B5M09_006845 [Aphanomyces astaci]|uniref:Uncharacterized protein n=1 Tax=Aphanomyces astaci TaxID=112090 RepID=A0A425C699_APHAT|nr:hypothetical protein B5M09_006845 [Aphanomyces astaci]
MDFKPPTAPHAVAHPVFACLSLNRSDRIRLIHFPPEAVQWVKGAILESKWSGGIQSTQVYAGNSYEFKLSGYPWDGNGSDATTSRRLMLCILRTLKMHGFHLVTATDMSRSEYDKDTLIFRLLEPSSVPPNMFSISLNTSDKLRLIDAPPELDVVVSECITKHWYEGLQRVQPYGPGCTEFKLRGYPWSGESSDAVRARLFVMNLLSILEANGWRLYASIDMSTGDADKDSWFFEAIASP